MNNKEKFIRAVKDTKKSSGIREDCLLCQIIGEDYITRNCTPCPLSDEEGESSCYNASLILDWSITEKQKNRVNYYKRVVIKILEETPARYFTRKDWLYFDKLHEYIDKIYNKIKEQR